MSSSTELMIELHSDHARALWGFALRLTGGDRAHAEDVVQETLLSAADRAAFVAHLRGCAECRQAVAEVEDLPGLLALVPAEGPVDPPASVLSGLLAEVERLEQADQLAARRAARGRRWWTGAGLAAAAAAGVVLSGQLVPMPWTEGAPVVV